MTQFSLDNSMRLAIRQVQTGRFDAAAQILQDVLAHQPNVPEAYHLLGIIALQKGALDAGIDQIRRAISLDPNKAEYHSNLGDALRQKGQFDDAIAECRRALQILPEFAEASNNLASALREKGELASAVAAYRRAIEFKPQYAEAYRNLGNLLREMNGASDEAIDALRHALRLNPAQPEIHDNLGSALRDAKKLAEAIAVFRDGVRLKPNRAETWNNLGNALNDAEKFDQAVSACREALRLQPEFPGAWNNLGNALRGRRQFDGAVGAYQRAIELNPEYAEAFMNLAIALHELGRFDEAIENCRHAIHLEPTCPEAHYNLGNILQHDGQIAESIAARREAIRLRPDYAVAWGNLGTALMDIGDPDGALAACETSVRLRSDLPLLFSNLVYFQLLHPDTDSARNLHAAKRWSDVFERPLADQIRPHQNDRSPNRRLRIGYGSPDYRMQSVGRFLAQLIPNHDRKNIEVFCYSDVQFGDDLTARFRQWADEWRDTFDLTDSELAERIRSDQIDILLDLALHTNGNRLAVFARKPAPIQMTWLGYPGTTGLSSIDYRLTDNFLDPPGEGDQFYTEKSIRLPHCFWCYGPTGPETLVAKLPALSAGHITFGCMNNFTKLNDRVLDLWAAILLAVPDCRLRIHMTRDRQNAILTRFSRASVEPNRIEFIGKQSFEKYFDEYHQIDIALDPFPYAGGTTTCDALWMGVPTVTLRGRTAVGRGGVSILSNVGLTEWIAENPQEYVSIAKQMASDLPKLADLRSGLRAQMQRSPLMDARQFAADIETVYRQIWHNWCANPS
jgi:protein O-GlcNAc transferase